MSTLLYFDALASILERPARTQAATLVAVAECVADTIASDHLIYVFGAGHTGIIAEEMFYRAGGLMPVVPIFGPGLSPQVEPITLGTDLERLAGYGRLLVDACGITPDDVLIVHSNSGRNTVAIELAEEARRRGVPVVALTSVAHSSAVDRATPRGTNSWTWPTTCSTTAEWWAMPWWSWKDSASESPQPRPLSAPR